MNRIDNGIPIPQTDFSKTEFEMKEIGSNEFLGVKVFKDFHDFKHAVLSNFEDNELPLMLKRSI